MPNPWVYIRIGSYVGLLEPTVYEEIVKPEFERIAKLVDSRKATPVLGAIFTNSAMTPTESLV